MNREFLAAEREFVELLSQWEIAKEAKFSACSAVYNKLVRTQKLPSGTSDNPTEEEMAKAEATRTAFEEIDCKLHELAKAAVRLHGS